MSGDGTQRNPLIIHPDELDLSALRAHCKASHKPKGIIGGRRYLGPMPRSNADLAAWHWGQHYHLHLGHFHGGPWVKVMRKAGALVTSRPRGYHTGEDARNRGLT